MRNNTSPLDSGGSTADSFTSDSLSESTSSVFSSPEPDHDTDIPRFNIREPTGDHSGNMSHVVYMFSFIINDSII